MTPYEKGFIEKCAEYEIDADSLVSELQKQAQQKAKGASKVIDALKKFFIEPQPEPPRKRTCKVTPIGVYGPDYSRERDLASRARIIKPVDKIKGFFTGKDPHYLALKRMNKARKERALAKRKRRMGQPSVFVEEPLKIEVSKETSDRLNNFFNKK